MHSIVILGDVRHHVIRIPQSKAWDDNGCPRPDALKTVNIPGGAFMMAQAIEDALLAQGVDLKNVKLYRPAPSDSRKPLGEFWEWELAPTRLAHFKSLRPRLTRGTKNIVPDRFHELGNDIVNALKDPKGKFEEYASDSSKCVLDVQLDECPDLLVIDDLDVSMRNVEISMTDRKRACDAARTRLNQPTTGDSKDSEQRFASALDLLFERFEQAKSAAISKGIPLMEPIILGSIKGNPSTAISKPNSIWNAIRNNDWLCQRTVVLLDAEDLRASELAVSTGLSWERTAQDTISQLRHSQELRPFLQFGQVIVRYGVTGALHIIKRTSTEWSYSLHFDATNDDTTWTVDAQDGVVLGYTSVYLATFAAALQAVCSAHHGHPFLGDFARTVSAALPSAIQRSRNLCAAGYGRKCWNEFTKRVPERRWCPDKLFGYRKERPSSNKPLAPLPQESSVPPLILREWSILGQSVQTRVSVVARDIVLFGADAVLNQPHLSVQSLRRALTKHLAIRAAEHQYRKSHGTSLSKEDWHKVFREAYEDLQQDHRAVGTRTPAQIGKFIELDLNKWVALKEVASLAGVTKRELRDHYLQSWRAEKFADAFASIIKSTALADVIADSVATPVLKYGKPGASLVVVDRREVEGFRAIEKLMRSHIQLVAKDKNERPLCIALFGPPGSGKSFAVKKINDTLANNLTTVLEPFNVSQMTQVTDLDNAFAEIARAGPKKKVPIAFFDEFDSPFGDRAQALGWLKFFLGPMEDGVFGRNSVSNAILVFAGGTSQTFADFSLANRSVTDPEWLKFSQAKGPDFTSRLSGHLDIVGINPADPSDELFLIRRAILIRSRLSLMQGLQLFEQARIDERMLRAILHVPNYLHGGRSVRMLLNLCATNDGRISASTVPPIHQLNMLVDGKSFIDLLTGVLP